MVPAERPSFSTEIGGGAAPALPLAAWALACCAFAVVAGAYLRLLAFEGERCALAAFCPPVLTVHGPWIVGALVVAGASFVLLPSTGGNAATLRMAGMAATIAGCASLVSLALASVQVEVGAFPVVLLAIGAPAAALGALDPAARSSARAFSTPSGWLRSGAVLAAAVAVGTGAGYLIAVATQAGPFTAGAGASQLVRTAWSVAAALLLTAGLLAWKRTRAASASMGGADENDQAAPRRLGLTPMLRNLLVAEASLALAGVASASAVLAVTWDRGAAEAIVLAVAGGGVVGAAGYMALAPGLDLALGRGRLLACTYVTSAAAPLLVAGYVSSGISLWLAPAAALFAFAACAAPQRIALVYDLCPSRSRLRSSLDFHAVRLALGSAGLPLVLYGGEVMPAFGLLLASAFGVFALSVFLPTLGGLGRRSA